MAIKFGSKVLKDKKFELRVSRDRQRAAKIARKVKNQAEESDAARQGRFVLQEEAKNTSERKLNKQLRKEI